MKKSRRILTGFAGIAALAAAAFVARPFLREPLQEKYRSSTAVYARGGELLRLTLSNDQKYRQWVPLEQISPAIKESFLRSEDKYFYSHFGINPVSLFRAGWNTYLNQGRRSGASTITMQLARMLGPLDSSRFAGKVNQIAIAFWLEYLYSKEEIFEAYLNLVPMGGNIEGVGAASLIFFKKRPSLTNWPEAMLLAVIPQNPNKRTLLRGFPDELKKARERLFVRVSELIPVAEKPLVKIAVTASHIKDLPFHSPHFVLNVLDQSPGKNEVRTTLDLPLQRFTEEKLRRYVEGKKSRGLKNGAILIANWQTSEILSWVGSENFFDSSINGQVDGVTSLRSPGSTLKPFIYGLAIEQGLIHPGTILKDSPKYFGAYDPENFDGEFRGPLSAETALNESRNLPAVELMSKLQSPDFYDFLVKTGAGKPRSRSFYGHSIALGGYEVTLKDLVDLYGALPRKGFLRKHITISDKKNKKFSSEALLSQESSFLVLDMLSKAHLQTSRFHRLERMNEIPVSWKTGTSSGFRDAWTVGVSGPYVVGVWLGNFSGEANRMFIGRELAAPLFFDLVDALKVKGKRELSSLLAWSPSGKVTKVEICPTSGKIPGPHCYHHEKVWFIPGTSPIAKCEVHRQIWISKLDGSLSCKPDPAKDIPRVHEFWPSDILEIFSAAGLPRKSVPNAGPTCERNGTFDSIGRGPSPEILSPRDGTTYSLRSQAEASKLIPFQGNHDSSAHELFWFVNNEYIGRSHKGSSLLWKARAGNFHVKAVDDLGRSSGRELRVQYVE